MKKNIYNIINTVWQLPAILVGIENEIWKNHHIPIISNKRRNIIKKIWKELDLLDDDYDLTKEGQEIVKLKSLLEYQIKMIPYHLKDNFYTKLSIKSSEYELLRNGLGEYFDVYLKDIFKELKYRRLYWDVLDYGGGDACYSKSFLKENPHSNSLIVDRILNFKEKDNLKFLKNDFEENKEWFLTHKNKYNLIILSELLHCKNKEWRSYLIDSCFYMLKQGGRLLICEKSPTLFFQWRMDIFTHGGECIDRSEIERLISYHNDNFQDYKHHDNFKSKFTFKNILKKESHYLMEYQKEEIE